MRIKGKLVDISGRRIIPAEISVKNGEISDIREIGEAPERYLLPGFIDAHVHVESSMLVPSEFARLAVVHGTVGTVSDPHEIANVLGMEGIRFMIANGKQVPFKFHFGAPSCVPATPFETAGATLGAPEIKALLSSPDVHYLSEMMNYPGVLNGDLDIRAKLKWARHFGKPVDGHAPGLEGEDVRRYIQAGISTDHECYTREEAEGKLALGMKVIIREGSAAKNFDALIGLLEEHYLQMMFCSDDKHPDDLILGHINRLCARAVARGFDLFKVLQVACVNPVLHYKMDVGLLGIGDPADFIVVENLEEFKVLETYIDGRRVARGNTSEIGAVPIETPNRFEVRSKKVEDFQIMSSSGRIRVIEAIDGALITGEVWEELTATEGTLSSDTAKDILKIAVVNRYENQPPAMGFIKNFGLRTGAIASSVAHDSHNIIAVGVEDSLLCEAVNRIIAKEGGICATDGHREELVPLPVAGIMSDLDGWTVAHHYQKVDALAKQLGCTLSAPFMTLSFMALLVIPDLKLSDKGLFSGKKFEFVALRE